MRYCIRMHKRGLRPKGYSITTLCSHTGLTISRNRWVKRYYEGSWSLYSGGALASPARQWTGLLNEMRANAVSFRSEAWQAPGSQRLQWSPSSHLPKQPAIDLKERSQCDADNGRCPPLGHHKNRDRNSGSARRATTRRGKSATGPLLP